MSRAITSGANSPADVLLQPWLNQGPRFFWAPTSTNLFRDHVLGYAGQPTAGAVFAPGGLANPVGNGTNFLSFSTNAGLTGTNYFQSMLLVYIPDKNNVTGSFLKVGGGSDGVSVGGGSTTHDDTGASLIILREGLAWYTNSASSWINGVNICALSHRSDNILLWANLSLGGPSSPTYLAAGLDTFTAPSSELHINGYQGSSARGTNATVLAVAIWPGLTLDGTATTGFWTGRYYEAKQLEGYNLQGMRGFFSTIQPRYFGQVTADVFLGQATL